MRRGVRVPPLRARLLRPAILVMQLACGETAAPEAAVCDGCRIAIDPVLALGSADGWDAFSQWASFELFGDRILLADAISYPGQVLHFHVDSLDERHVIGRPGEGPGEIRRIGAMWIDEDGMHVFDPGLDRETVFSATGELIRSTRYEPGSPASRAWTRIRLPDGRFVVNASIRAGEGAGYLLHVLDADHSLVRSFEVESTPPASYQPFRDRRALALASDGHLWVGQPNEYRLEKWSRDGDLLETATWDHPWFETWHAVETTDYTVAPPPPTLWAIQEDSANGLLWLHFALPDASYRPINPNDGREHRVDNTRLNDLFDSAIDVRELPSLRLLHRQRFDTLFTLAGPQIVRTLELTDEGFIRLTIGRLHLEGYARPGAIDSIGAPLDAASSR